MKITNDKSAWILNENACKERITYLHYIHSNWYVPGNEKENYGFMNPLQQK